MAITLADIQQQSTDTLVKGVVYTLREKSMLMDSLSFETVSALKVQNYRSGATRSVKSRRIGEAHKASPQGRPTPVEDSLFSLGAPVRIDKAILRDKSAKLYDPEAVEIEQVTEGMAVAFAENLIHNTPLLDPDMFTGLNYRLANELSAQSFVADGSGLNLSPKATDYAQNNDIFFRVLDKAISMCADKTPTFCLCNDTFLRNLNAIARESRFLRTDKDSLGRAFTAYGDGKVNVKFIDMGYRFDSELDKKIITDSQTVDGAEGTVGTDFYTSIYLVKQGAKYFQPIQEYPLEVGARKLLDDDVTYQTVIDWVVGIIVTHPRSIVRVTGLKME